MRDHRPGSGSWTAELGHPGDRVSHDDPLRLDLGRRGAAHARPRLHGLAPGPVTGRTDEINLAESRRRPTRRRDRPRRPDRRVHD